MALQLQSNISKKGILELSLADVETPKPKADQVVIRVEAAPINPSDLGTLFSAADMGTAKQSGTAERPVITATIPEQFMKYLAARVDTPLPAGNEGAGIVVAAGESAAAQALMGKTVAIIGGGMYSQFRLAKAEQCLVLPQGTTPAEGASCFVNPLTALGMTGTMQREGHKALVHTAAASNLGQMLVRLCLADGIELVNIVRKPEQEKLLRGLGAKHVCNSSLPSFAEDLTKALVATGATLAFDATGGGELASQILSCMEVALLKTEKVFTPYGSSTHKQVYLYGRLDRSPTVLLGNYGMTWGVGGWLLTTFLQKIGADEAQQLRERVAAEVKTTFASNYTREVSLAEALSLEALKVYGKTATGAKFLVHPNKGL